MPEAIRSEYPGRCIQDGDIGLIPRPPIGRSVVAVLSLSAGTYGAIAFSAATSVVLGRELGAAGFGRVALLLVAAAILDIVVSNWTLPLLIRSGAHEWVTQRRVGTALWSRSILVLPWLALALVLVIVFAEPAMRYLGVGPVGLALVLAYFVATGIAQTAGAVLRAVDRMARLGAVLMFERAVVFVLVVMASLVFDLSAELALACYAAAALGAGLWALSQVGATALSGPLPSRAGIAEAIRFSLPLLAGSWAGLFGDRAIDYVVIRGFLPLEELGAYAVAYQSAGLLQQALIVVSSFMLPRFVTMLAAARDRELHDLFSRLAPHALLGFSVLCAVAILAAPALLPFMFGPAFAASVGPFRWLAVVAAVFAIFSALNPLLMAHGIVWPVTRGVVLAVVVNVVLDVVLVPRYGIEGAAAASLASYFVTTISVVAAAWRLGINAFPLLAFAAPPAAVGIWTADRAGPAGWIGGSVLLFVLTLLLVRRFGLFGSAERTLIRRAWSS